MKKKHHYLTKSILCVCILIILSLSIKYYMQQKEFGERLEKTKWYLDIPSRREVYFRNNDASPEDSSYIPGYTVGSFLIWDFIL